MHIPQTKEAHMTTESVGRPLSCCFQDYLSENSCRIVAIRAKSLCRWDSSAIPTLPYAGNVVSATFLPPIPSRKPTHRPSATISISVLQTGLNPQGQRRSLQPVWERGDLGCGLGRGSRVSMNKFQLQHCIFLLVRANVSFFLSAMA